MVSVVVNVSVIAVFNMCEVEGVTVDFLRVGESACDESSYKSR